MLRIVLLEILMIIVIILKLLNLRIVVNEMERWMTDGSVVPTSSVVAPTVRSGGDYDGFVGLWKRYFNYERKYNECVSLWRSF